MKQYLFGCAFMLLLTGCFGGKLASSQGGEVTGTGGRAFTEPTPYGMTLVKRGHLKMGTHISFLWNRSLWHPYTSGSVKSAPTS